MTDSDLPATFDAGQLSLGEVASLVGGSATPPVEIERTWYDTFDRRLWSADLVLEVDRRIGAPDSGQGVVLRDRSTNAVRWVDDVASVPRLAADLPPGPWRRSLAKALGIRALLPLASAPMTTASVTLTDRRGKVVVGLVWEQSLGADGSAPGRSRPTAVRVMPMRGYQSAATKLARMLRSAQGIRPGGPGLDGLLPPPTKVIDAADVELDPALTAAEASRTLLSSLWATMRATEPWLADPPDTEFLHDYRVALRRSRSVLKASRRVVSDDVLAAWRPRLRHLQQRTNRARDLDVFLLELPSYLLWLPPDVIPDLDPLRALLLEMRAEDQHLVVGYLESADHADFRRDYGRLLASPFAESGPPLASRPVAEVATSLIRRAHARVVKAGAAITPDSPPTDLHALRILAKELRYGVEMYGSLYDPVLLGAVVRELKALQDNLGAFQDNEVHAFELAGFGARLHQAGRAGTPTMVALFALAAAFSQRQALARAEFADRFAAFNSKGNRKRLDVLVSSARRRSGR